MGTLPQQLSLPVSRRLQFAIKLAMTLAIAGVLSAVLMFSAEKLALVLGAPRGVLGDTLTAVDAAVLLACFLAFAYVGFYASTLARNVLQAAGLAVLSIVGLSLQAILVSSWLNNQWILFVGPLEGFIFSCVSTLALLLALLWLAWRNFRSEAGSGYLWRINVMGIVLALGGSAVLTAGICNRVWEFLTPAAEPPAGPPRLIGTKPVVMHPYWGGALTALLPDGRLRIDRLDYERRARLFAGSEEVGVFATGHWTNFNGGSILPGSNWMCALATFRDTVAIRSDGTLWASQILRAPHSYNEAPRFQEEAALVQVGSDNDWRDVVPEPGALSVVLLKRDGTLWRLGGRGTNSLPENPAWRGLHSFVPRRLVSAAGWDRILDGHRVIYAWKDDGSAWILRGPEAQEISDTNKAGVRHWHSEAEPNENGVVLERAAYLDNAKWLGMAQFAWSSVGLREDGTLWTWQIKLLLPYYPYKHFTGPHFTRVGGNSDWTELSGLGRNLTLRKNDGSIWQWCPDERSNWRNPLDAFKKPPIRLGSRKDWVAVADSRYGSFSLAGDGALCLWWSRAYGDFACAAGSPLKPPRGPVFIENILSETTR
jgi:hypothetical protein